MGKYQSIEKRKAELSQFVGQHFGDVLELEERDLPVTQNFSGIGSDIADDDELIANIRSSKQEEKFNRLFDNEVVPDYDGDSSRADMALVVMLIYWVGSDRERIDRLMRRSARFREKWDSRRGNTTYGFMTIEKAIQMKEREIMGAFESANDESMLAVDSELGEQAKIGKITKFELLPLTQLTPSLNTPSLVKGLIPDGSLVVLYGAPNTGKSFIAVDMAMSVATGKPFLEHPTIKATVVYLAAEGGSGIRNRFAAARSDRGLDGQNVSLYLIPQSADLSNPQADAQSLIEAIKGVYQSGQPLLVIVDTLHRVMAGADENSASDMSSMLAAVERIQHEYNATVVLIHHSGKDSTRGERGHSSLRAALDTSLEVKVNGSERFLKVKKQRDLPIGRDHPFNLRPIELGRDSDGDPVTTCVVDRPSWINPQDFDDSGDFDRYELNTKQRRAARALQELLQDSVEQPPPDLKQRIGETPVVSLKRYKGRLADCQMSESVVPAYINTAINRVIQQLQEKDVIEKSRDYVWFFTNSPD